MKRLAIPCLCLCLLLAMVARPVQAARPSSLDSLELLDWYYAGEKPYQALAEAARVSGRGGWLLQRLVRGEKIPQAPARELALELEANPGVDPVLQGELKMLFREEGESLDLSGAAGLTVLENKFALMNRKLEDLEASRDRNNFDKGSFPGLSSTFNSRWVSSGADKLFPGHRRGTLLGQINLFFEGVTDAGKFSFGIGQSFSRLDDTEALPSHRANYGNGGLSFLAGWRSTSFEVSLGDQHGIEMSTLVMAAPASLASANLFHIDFDESGRPDYNTVELDLGLPSGSWWMERGIFLTKQGTSPWWPFTSFTAFYTPEPSFFEVYTDKAFLWGVGADLDLGPRLGIFERILAYGAVTGAANHEDLLRTYGQTDFRGSFGWAVGLDQLMTSGTQLYAEFGGNRTRASNETYLFADPSHLAGWTGGQIKGFQRQYSDTAFVLQLGQPLNFVNLAVEYSRVGPLFEPRLGAVSSMKIDGVDNDVDVGFQNGSLTPWKNPPEPGGRVEGNSAIVDNTRDIAWGSDMSLPTSLLSNTQKIVGKAGLAWSWISVDFFAGAATQLKASGPWMKTQPFFEGGNGGRMLYDHFGALFFQPPAPFDPRPSEFLGSATDLEGPNPNYPQWLFNRPTDGMAVYDNLGNSLPVHWQAISQVGYREVEFNMLFSENGIGDPRLAADSTKVINYAAAKTRLDFQALFGSFLPHEVVVAFELRELAGGPGLPTTGGGKESYFSQAQLLASGRFGLSRVITLVGMAGLEKWKSEHSFYPLEIDISQWGLGCDMEASELLTGLSFFARGKVLDLHDKFFSQRDFKTWELTMGTNLSF